MEVVMMVGAASMVDLLARGIGPVGLLKNPIIMPLCSLDFKGLMVISNSKLKKKGEGD